MQRAQLQLRQFLAHPWSERQGDVRVTVHSGPAMIAAVQRPDGSFGAVHQTWLDLDQPKGKVVLPALDVSREAGGPGRAVVREFKGVRVGRELTVTLTPDADAAVPVPVLSGVEVLAEGW